MKIYQQNAYSVLNMIIHKESQWYEKNVVSYLFSPEKGPFAKVIHRSSH